MDRGSTVRFITDAEHYQWLNDVLATYDGTFNERTGTAHLVLRLRASPMKARAAPILGSCPLGEPMWDRARRWRKSSRFASGTSMRNG